MLSLSTGKLETGVSLDLADRNMYFHVSCHETLINHVSIILSGHVCGQLVRALTSRVIRLISPPVGVRVARHPIINPLLCICTLPCKNW